MRLRLFDTGYYLSTMTEAESRRSDSDGRPLGLLAVVTGVSGMAAAIALMLWVGRRNPSRLILLMFAIWVSAPFVALLAAQHYATRSSPRILKTLRALTVVVALVTVAAYAYVAFGPSRPQPAFTFLVTPPLSVLAVLLVLGLVALRSRASV